MRKNSVRKFIHAVLDLLPVIIIPIFALAVRSDNGFAPQTIEYSQNEIVEFNQYYNNSVFVSGSTGYSSVNNTVNLETDKNSGYIILRFGNAYFNNKYYFDFVTSASFVSREIYCEWSGISGTFSSSVSPFIFQFTNNYSNCGLLFNISSFTTNDFITINVFNLTQMFGEGNEPTISEFNSYYSDDYYSYNTGTRQLLKDVSFETYSNTDVGSQMVYALYTPIHDYMNFNNVFNFGAIYDWLQFNIFNGTAPLPVFIIWNIIVYEFLVDLLFLFYAVFMFVIDFAQKCLDRPFRRM